MDILDPYDYRGPRIWYHTSKFWL